MSPYHVVTPALAAGASVASDLQSGERGNLNFDNCLRLLRRSAHYTAPGNDILDYIDLTKNDSHDFTMTTI